MPVQFDLPESTNLLDALAKGYAINQQRIKSNIASKYAEPMAQSNLDRLKSLIQGSNLANQAEQLKMPFIAPTAQSTLDKLKSEIARINTETQFIPTKYQQAANRLGIQQGNLDLNRQRFSPEQLQALMKWRLAQTSAKEAGNQPVDIHGIPIGQLDTSGTPQEELKDQWIPSKIGKSQTGAPERYYNPKTDETLVKFTKPEANQIGKQKVALESSLKLLPKIIEIGSKGFLGAPNTGANKILDPNLRAKYESLQSQLTETLSPTFPNLPKVKQMMAKVDALSKRFPGETADAYASRVHDLMNDFNEQLLDINQQYTRGGRIIKGSKSIPSKEQLKTNENFPSFNSKEEFNKWRANASPEQIQAYKEHLHG